MRLLVRAALVVALLTSALLTSASPATAALPTPAPTATLTSVSVIFQTRDDDKDQDSPLELGLFSKQGYSAAFVSDTFGHFDPNSTNGPYYLKLSSTTWTAADVSNGLFRLAYIGNWGTWQFDYTLQLYFSDGTKYVISQSNVLLSTAYHGFDRAFTLGPQVAVPDLRGRTPANATTALQAAGLKRGTVTTQVDPNCDYIGTVMKEVPRIGAVVDVGTSVDLITGTEPSTRCR